MTAALRRQQWLLEARISFLNHGSFGACPRPVLHAQNLLRRQLEREPVRFLWREWDERMDHVRQALAAFLGAGEADLAWVPNATIGVNTVLRSLRFEPGDELLITDHAYNACRNALEQAATQGGARVVVAHVPFPLASAAQITEAILGCVTPRTRLALIDHVTSPTALVFPLAALVRELARAGVDTLVDGAHAPGMVPIDLAGLGAAYYTGNLHKWVCAPKGSAFLHVRPDRQDGIRPLPVSHGANSRRTDRTRFQLAFDWTGTDDPTPFLAVPTALRFLGRLLPGGLPALMQRNRALALEARRRLCRDWSVEPPCPDDLVGSMAAIPLPDGVRPLQPPLFIDSLQDVLWNRHHIEIPVMAFPLWPHRLIRLSAQAYNEMAQYRRLSKAVTRELAEERAMR